MSGRESPPLRVAIVGFGPRGLFALERFLDSIAGQSHGRPVEIVLFEPHPVPGAGPVYDPSQPAYLRMNLAADRVTLWPQGSRASPGSAQLTFEQWCSCHSPDREADPYGPRAEVGRYLAWGTEELIRFAPERVRISIRPRTVTAVERGHGGRCWQVSAGADTSEHDEVLLATGHAVDWPGALRHAWQHPITLVDSVFPVQSQLDEVMVPSESRVAVRGFALTFIDAALALTEGRGGSFVAGPSGLCYRASGAEPAIIVPFSRSGKPMLAKPESSVDGRRVLRNESGIAEGRRAIIALPAKFRIDPDLISPLEQLIRAAGADPVEGSAWGAAWRALYPAIVNRLGGTGLEPGEWPAFRALAAEMERVAFGPPAVNVAKVRALVDVGLIDLGHVRGAAVETVGAQTSLRSSEGKVPLDLVVDAVLPPPGAAGLGIDLFDRLLESGHARVPPGRRGLELDGCGSCVGAHGSSIEGLAATGRASEDWVIGNDTLARDLHPQLNGWARRVAARCLDSSQVPVAVGG